MENESVRKAMKAIEDSILNVPLIPSINIPSMPSTRLQPNIPIPSNPVVSRLDAELASVFYQRLKNYVIDFEKELSVEEEVGLRLVSFGETVSLHVEDIGFSNPSLICFYGTNEHGRKMQLIQHVSQISFLLTVVPRIDPARERIGFILQSRSQ